DRYQPNFTDPVVLIRAPYRVSFSYAGPDRTWRDTWQQSDQLPRAIRLKLQDAQTQTTVDVSTATLVHAEVPVDCLTASSLADCQKSLLRPRELIAGDTPRNQGGGQTQ